MAKKNCIKACNFLKTCLKVSVVQHDIYVSRMFVWWKFQFIWSFFFRKIGWKNEWKKVKKMSKIDQFAHIMLLKIIFLHIWTHYVQTVMFCESDHEMLWQNINYYQNYGKKRTTRGRQFLILWNLNLLKLIFFFLTLLFTSLKFYQGIN